MEVLALEQPRSFHVNEPKFCSTARTCGYAESGETPNGVGRFMPAATAVSFFEVRQTCDANALTIRVNRMLRRVVVQTSQMLLNSVVEAPM